MSALLADFAKAVPLLVVGLALGTVMPTMPSTAPIGSTGNAVSHARPADKHVVGHVTTTVRAFDLGSVVMADFGDHL